MNDLSSPKLRIADYEACYHAKRQIDCLYYNAHRCRCNVPGDEVWVNGVHVRYIEAPAKRWFNKIIDWWNK
jgi:hypothetical protein